MTAEKGAHPSHESSGDGNVPPVGGERLAEARRARGISVREIAKELHLDEPKVRALEENRFDVFGAPVFAKGHMRKYAELLDVPIDDVLAEYYQLNRAVGVPPVVGPRRKIRREISPGPWLAAIVVIVVAASAGWWWWGLQPSAERVTAQPATRVPLEVDRSDDAVTEVAEDATPVEEEAAVATAPAPAIEVVEPTDDTVASAGTVELMLSFSGDCWTEVSDASGRRLFFDLGTEGRTVTLTGVEPLGVLLGDSSNVSVRVNGFDYSIPAANRRGNTARLTIYSQ